MKKNVRLLSTISIVAALAGGAITALNDSEGASSNSTVEAASITLPSGYTKSAIIKLVKLARLWLKLQSKA